MILHCSIVLILSSRGIIAFHYFERKTTLEFLYEMEGAAESKRWNCRDNSCNKSFSNKSNRDRHERKADHAPPNRRDSILNPVFNEESMEYGCPLLGCNSTSKYKSNISRHIKAGCPTLSVKEDNRVCPHCKQIFTQKSNRDRHVKRMHPAESEILSNFDEENDSEIIPTFDQDTADVMNVSFLSNDGSNYT